jgi:hypothetical protein
MYKDEFSFIEAKRIPQQIDFKQQHSLYSVVGVMLSTSLDMVERKGFQQRIVQFAGVELVRDSGPFLTHF